jgi:hypothetical protein
MYVYYATVHSTQLHTIQHKSCYDTTTTTTTDTRKCTRSFLYGPKLTHTIDTQTVLSTKRKYKKTMNEETDSKPGNAASY